MAVSYAAALQTARMQDVADLVAAKTIVAASGAGSAGKLVIGTSALSGATGVLATFTLANPALTVAGSPPNVRASIAAGSLPLNTTVSGAGTQTAAKAEFRTSADAVIVSGLTVGVGTGDIQLNSTSLTNGQTVTLTAGYIEHAA